MLLARPKAGNAQPSVVAFRGVVFCKEWFHSGHCHWREVAPSRCSGAHEVPAGLPSRGILAAQFVEEKAQQRRETCKTVTGLEQILSRTKRAELFAAWAMEWLPCRDAKILDIAGGRGEVSFDLFYRHGLQGITLIDPRPAKLSKKQRRYLQQRFKEIPEMPIPQRACLFDEHFIEAEKEPPGLLAGSPILLGLHPDEATEAIVDAALGLGCSFAVVPCCVFTSLRPRLLKSGQPATSYEDFLIYLEEKDQSIRRAVLPFSGKNIVLWRVS
jgi:hypothetical protein